MTEWISTTIVSIIVFNTVTFQGVKILHIPALRARRPTSLSHPASFELICLETGECIRGLSYYIHL